jgi:hypothetical protein
MFTPMLELEDEEVEWQKSRYEGLVTSRTTHAPSF